MRQFMARMAGYALMCLGGVLAGCSGGANGLTAASPVIAGTPVACTGTLALTINWPQQCVRAIPASTQSIAIRVWYGTEQASEQQLVNRPSDADSSTVAFTVPAGTVSYQAMAYAEPDGGGLEIGTLRYQEALVSEGQIVEQTLDLDLLAADYLSIFSSENTFVLCPGQPITLYARAATHGPLAYETLIQPDAIRWSSADPRVASIEERTGRLLAHAVGTTQITVTDCDRQLSATIPIFVYAQCLNPGVNGNARLRILPSTQSGSLQKLFAFSTELCVGGQPTDAYQVRWDWEGDGIFDTPYLDVPAIEYQYHTITTPGPIMTIAEACLPDGRTVTATVPMTLTNALFRLTGMLEQEITGTVGTEMTLQPPAVFESGQVVHRYDLRYDWNADGIYDTSWYHYDRWLTPEHSIEPVVTHCFPTPGSYPIRLQVMMNPDEVMTLEQTIHICSAP